MIGTIGINPKPTWLAAILNTSSWDQYHIDYRDSRNIRTQQPSQLKRYHRLICGLGNLLWGENQSAGSLE